MKIRNNRILCIVLIFAISSIFLARKLPLYSQTPYNHPKPAYSIAPTIVIDNNWTETEAAGICTGEGTPENPYLIENKEINAEGVGSVIWIKDTIEFFKISGCYLNDSGSEAKDSGIYMYNVSNGFIFNNTFRGGPESSNCVYMEYTNNINITHNTMRNQWGVFHDAGCSNIAMYYNNLLSSLSSLFFTDYNSTTYHSETMFLYTYEDENYTSYIGNYWNDQTHIDEDGNGISDISVQFTNSHTWVVDTYQLMEPIQNYILLGPYEPKKIPGYPIFIILATIAFSTLILYLHCKKQQN